MSRDDRWQHLVTCAFALEEAPAEARQVELARVLASVAEVFPRTLDPVEDFEGYAVRRFVLALTEAVSAVQCPP